MDRLDLFPTEVWKEDLDHIDNEELTNVILKMEQEESTVKSSFGYPISSAGGWHGEPDLHNKENIQLQNILESIGKVTDEIKRYNHFLKGIKTECIAMWANVNRYKDYNTVHVHPNCNYSGVYYIKTPENCGTLSFIDPRKERRMLMDSSLYDVESTSVPAAAAHTLIITPKEGRLVLFPCFLEHEVGANQTNEPRISISFNIRYRI
mgnify:CR=1 FL=1